MSHSISSQHMAEHVAKRFYQNVRPVLIRFLKSIQGNINPQERQEYTSLMLYRLLVLYFLQKHGLLDGDYNYLQHRLLILRQNQGDGLFYRHYLIPLFSILQRKPNTVAAQSLPFGQLPALQLPLFELQALEVTQSLFIPDEMFSLLFACFDAFQWRLTGSSQIASELYPDILSYIFERHINQKQAGAYYTESDVTSYIASNTIIPYLLHALQEYCTNTLVTFPWQSLLQAHPDRYISASILHPSYLPEESEREYQRRRAWHAHLYQLLAHKQIDKIADLITYNLNASLLLEDFLCSNTDPALLYHLYTCLSHMTILDPTCGSGAFLFAAQSLLTHLYMLCYNDMRTFIEQETTNQHYIALFHSILSSGTDYQITLRIQTHNLYGVDVMPAAVDMCRLRLYLSLLAHVRHIKDVPVFPSISQHIRAGNILAGQGQGFQWHLEFPDIQQKCGFDVIIGNPPFLEHARIKHDYAISGYEEKSCGNLYVAVIEQAIRLSRPDSSYLGLIVPISICSGARFTNLRWLLQQQFSHLWLANFEIFPCRLFANAFQRVSILLAHQHAHTNCELATTKIYRWYASERSHLLSSLFYTPVPHIHQSNSMLIPKLATSVQAAILNKLYEQAQIHTLAQYLQPQATSNFVYYQEATNYWIKALCQLPFYKKNGIVMQPPHGRLLYFTHAEQAHMVMAILNSSLFYLWFATYSDGFHLSHALVKNFPLHDSFWHLLELVTLSYRLEEDMQRYVRFSTRNTQGTLTEQGIRHSIELAEYQLGYSKPILDQIDNVLAQHYHFTEEELDFIIHYDVKHRLSNKRRHKFRGH